MSEKPFKPPQKDRKDLAHTSVKAAIGSVPFVGGAGAEFFSYLLASPVERRKEEWAEEVGGALRDLTGRDLIIGISMDRELYRTGLANIYTNLALLAIWAILTGLIVAIVMDRTVLHRVGRLTDHVRSLSGSKDADLAPVLLGNDELAGLEKTIITSRNDLQMREQQLRAFVNAMPGAVALFFCQPVVVVSLISGHCFKLGRRNI